MSDDDGTPLAHDDVEATLARARELLPEIVIQHADTPARQAARRRILIEGAA